MLGLDDVKRQIAALCLIMLLSIDAINPVKALCSVFEIDAAVVGYVHFVILIAVVYANFSDVAYFAMQVYLNSVLSIFLKSIEIVGKENVPMTGPVIFTGNHTNQFVDGMLVLMNCFRKVGFLIAEKSMHRPVVGDIARIMGCIPIVRPQDAVLPGVGTVAMKDDDQPDAEEYILVGTDTAFTKALASGDQVRVNGTSVATSGPPVKVVRVIDDTHLVLSAALVDHEGQAVKTPQAYGIFKKVDQSHAFNEVYASLKRGQCVGIFPEGGSHDRTDLLPLKAGVALMALGAKAQHDITVPVVPIGLTYFRGHHFRSRVVIEFGAPITVSDEVMALYAKDKRAACNDFLTTVEEGMRSVLVTTPDYNVLQNVYTARRLFQSRRLPRKITQDLNRRFAESYKILHDHPAARDEVETLMMDLRDYRVTLKTLGLADYQVPFVADVDVHSMISAASYFLGMFILSSLPSIILNAPVGFAARAVARQEQKRALAGSSVKIAARDVILSKKLTFSMVAVPTLWCTYLILAILFTSWSWTTIFLFAMSMPIFSYFGVRSVEAGIIELKTLQPVFNRLRPKYRKIQEELPARRIALQKRVRAFVSKWASVLGPLAAPEPMDWAAYMRARVNKQDAVSDNGETITTEHDLSFLHHKSVNVDAAAVALDKKTVFRQHAAHVTVSLLWFTHSGDGSLPRDKERHARHSEAQRVGRGSAAPFHRSSPAALPEPVIRISAIDNGVQDMYPKAAQYPDKDIRMWISAKILSFSNWLRAEEDMFGLDSVRQQIIVTAVIIMLSMDVVNPIKAVCSVLGMDSSAVGWLHILIMLGLLYSNVSDVIYFCIRVFLTSILSIFFKDIQIVGKDNIPMDGPVIFTGNHSNQFVDGMIVLMNCYRKVGFIIAEKSMHRPIVGHLSKALGCIPFTRPQDEVIKGKGLVSVQPENSCVLVGEDTQFLSQLAPGDQVRANGKTVKDSGAPVKVEKVQDDTHIVLSSPLLDINGAVISAPTAFGILKKVDQKGSFGEVFKALNRGQCVGIFPEGGSHDRTDLLPLKAGVALMAFGVKETYNLTVPIVPVGLNYFRGHKFRGRVVVEFGTPITITPEKMDAYRVDKRKACNALLNEVQDGMRSVIVTTPDYNVLQSVYAARRLYQPSGIKWSPKVTQDLNRRFAEGYKILKDVPAAAEDLADLTAKITDYRRTLKQLGLADHQVPYIGFLTLHDLLSTATYGFVIFVLASLPTFVLNAPVGILARYVAAAEQNKALAGSNVKIAARDVVLSKKITFSVVAVPVLWLSYMALAFIFTNWKTSNILLLTMSFPLFSYFGVRSVEAGIIELRTLRPLMNRLRPEYKRIQDELPVRRNALQKEVRHFVKKYTSEVGPLADPKPVNWTEFMHTHVKHEDEPPSKPVTDSGDKSVSSTVEDKKSV